MASFNKVILMGNLTRDPEMKQAPSGNAVADFRLAVSDRYRDKQTGETKEVTCYVDVVAWARQAEICQQYLAKGRPVLVEGRLQYDEWKTKEGENRSKLRVRADSIRLLSQPGTREAAGASAGNPPAAAAATPAAARAKLADDVPPESAGDTDDLPF
ncbi:MAG: single-stranded DNA-binding protein [Lentisphaerae bacterium]|nr:single-stranded DNA-binding protein [Lentisphaerota bacterium]